MENIIFGEMLNLQLHIYRQLNILKPILKSINKSSHSPSTIDDKDFAGYTYGYVLKSNIYVTPSWKQFLALLY